MPNCRLSSLAPKPHTTFPCSRASATGSLVAYAKNLRRMTAGSGSRSANTSWISPPWRNTHQPKETRQATRRSHHTPETWAARGGRSRSFSRSSLRKSGKHLMNGCSSRWRRSPFCAYTQGRGTKRSMCVNLSSRSRGAVLALPDAVCGRSLPHLCRVAVFPALRAQGRDLQRYLLPRALPRALPRCVPG
jgi:hypothetical protein